MFGALVTYAAFFFCIDEACSAPFEFGVLVSALSEFLCRIVFGLLEALFAHDFFVSLETEQFFVVLIVLIT